VRVCDAHAPGRALSHARARVSRRTEPMLPCNNDLAAMR